MIFKYKNMQSSEDENDDSKEESERNITEKKFLNKKHKLNNQDFKKLFE